MPRRARCAPGGLLYHVLNRAVARLPLFQKPGDYDAFESVLVEALAEHPTRLLSYCIMPNHWHMIVWPRQDDELTAFARWLTHTHTMRWHAHYHTSGTGHLYQGRFKSFPIEADDHFYVVARYVERNALRASLVEHAAHWRWCSLWHRQHAGSKLAGLLHAWPVALPTNWAALVQEPQTEGELKAIRRALVRGSPFGAGAWREQTIARLGLESTVRRQGRPRKAGCVVDPTTENLF